jgi:hypothetical protein
MKVPRYKVDADTQFMKSEKLLTALRVKKCILTTDTIYQFNNTMGEIPPATLVSNR